MHVLLFGAGSRHLKRKIRIFFSGKIVTSLDYIFTIEKALVKIIFSRKMYIYQPIFKIFEALLTTFG